jgi:MazG family protein
MSDSTPSPVPPAFDRATVEAVRDPFQRLCLIMKCLLDPGGCPWDREQSHASLKQYLIEESYETLEAIDEGDDAALSEELGDVGLQVVFHAELARRRGAFDIDTVYEKICRKLIDRHPHVFGDAHAPTSGDVLRNWEQIKKEEKRQKALEQGRDHKKISALSGVPRALPGLQRATRLQEKASRVGFDWDRPEDVAAKVREEVEEFLAHVGAAGEGSAPADDSPPAVAARAEGPLEADAMTEEFGDLLFSLVNYSRFLNIRAEEAIERACNKFIRRFTAVERSAETDGKHLKDMTLAEMDALWNEVKRGEK